MDTTNLAMQPFTLAFKSAEVEGEFLGEVAKKRWPVLVFIFCFDVLCFLFRFTAKLSGTAGSPDGEGCWGFSITNRCLSWCCHIVDWTAKHSPQQQGGGWAHALMQQQQQTPLQLD